MNYETYWSILDTPANTTKSNIIALIIAIVSMICLILIKKFKEDKGDGDKNLLLWFTGVLSVSGLIMSVFLTYFYKDNSDAQMAKALDLESAKKVEGVVSNFHRTFRRGRYGSETIEIFTIDSVQFAYGNSLLGRFISFSETYNNFIYDGQHIRVTYSDDSPYGNGYKSIFKIELKRK